MKKLIIGLSLFTTVFMACEKGNGYSDPSIPSSGARVKFINASWNAPALIFYGGDTTIKFSAVAPGTGNVITGIAYGSTYPSFDYALLGTYSDSLKVRVPTNATTMPGLFTGIGKLYLEDGKNYSVFVVDSFPTLSALVVRDSLMNYNSIYDTAFVTRFVNTIYGSPAVDVYSKNENAVIFSNVPYKGNTSFKSFRRNSLTPTDSIFVRLAGTTTTVGSARIAFTPSGKRTYTLFARGRYGSTTSTPSLSFYTNQ